MRRRRLWLSAVRPDPEGLTKNTNAIVYSDYNIESIGSPNDRPR